MLEEIFETIGFHKEEAKIYILLLEIGAAPASLIAKKLTIPRPTAYRYIEKLSNAGLVSESLAGGVKSFQAEPPSKLKLLYTKHIEKLEKKSKKLDLIMPALESKISMGSFKPRMHFYEGREGIESIWEDLLQYPNTETFAFWPITEMLQVVGEDFIYYHNKERIKRGIYIQAIWFKGREVSYKRYPFLGSSKKHLREIRIAPETIKPTMGYWVYGHKTMMISSDSESFGMIIESREFADMMTAQHKLIWNISVPRLSKGGEIAPFIEEIS